MAAVPPQNSPSPSHGHHPLLQLSPSPSNRSLLQLSPSPSSRLVERHEKELNKQRRLTKKVEELTEKLKADEERKRKVC